MATRKSITRPVAVPAPDESQILAKATIRAADLLQLTSADLARIIGLSEASISRLRAGQFELQRGTKPFELSVLLVRLFRALDAMTGGDEASRSWLQSRNLALAARPIDLIVSVSGLVQLIQYVDTRRAVL